MNNINIENYLYIPKHLVTRCNLPETAYISKEDMYIAGCIALCEAAISYDSNKNTTFKTYAFMKVRFALYDVFRNQFPLKHDIYDADELKIRFEDIDTIPDSEAISYYENLEYVLDLFKLLTSREKLIIYNIYYKGLTGVDIAKHLKVEQSGINRSRKTALLKMRRALKETA